MSIVRDRDSQEYTTVRVTADVELDQPVEMAVVRTRPVADDWKTAAWVGDPSTTRDAQLPPSDTDGLATGTWKIFVRLTDSPEIPVMSAGRLIIR